MRRLAILLLAQSALAVAARGEELKYDLFGGIVTEETKLDTWSRGTIKTIGDNEVLSAEGGFEPGALVGKVINPNFERPLGVVDDEMRKKYGDAPQYCAKYYRITGNTENTIKTDPADGRLTEYAQAGDKYLLCGFFTVKKAGDRFVAFTPLGHPFFGFGVDSCYLGYWGYLPREKDWYKLKHDANRAKWYTATAQRMKAAGFNMSAGYFSDVPLWAPGKREVFLKPEMPFIAWHHPLEMGMKAKGAKGGLFDSPIKDVFDGCQYGRDAVHGRNCGDIFDPQFAEACRIEAERQAKAIRNNPWFMGYIIEESDFLFAFARDRSQFHLGWGVIASLPVMEQSGRGEYGQPKFADTRNYAKLALRDLLKNKYSTLEKLNQAWGSTYSTWDSAEGGYGKGSGLLDENGVLGKAWLGAKHTMKGGNAAAYGDLSEFLYLYVDKLHQIEAAALRKEDPNHWLICSKVPADLKEYQAVAKHVDMLRGVPPKGATGDEIKPGILALYLSADEDSAMHVYYDPPAKGPYRDAKTFAKTQPEKAELYRQQLLEGFNYAPDGKVRPAVMMSYWSWAENASEKRNWGVVSLKDNLYDGKEATRLGADGKAGTWDDEDRDYGDCVTGMRQANNELLKQLREFMTRGK